ncbi:MAG: hypothetical protein OXU75_04470 [Deltaproteobacteria bacterium]|nr:hypothetical protein [Deltaproteobacteria bacterium]
MQFVCAIAFVVLFAAAPLAASEDWTYLSSDPGKRTRALIDSGRFVDALFALHPVALVRPDRTDVLFLVGLAALGAPQLPGTPQSGDRGPLEERNG